MQGSKWKHYKGNTYEVLHVGKDADTEATVIVYERDGQVWVRPAYDWFDVLLSDDVAVGRFELEEVKV